MLSLREKIQIANTEWHRNRHRGFFLFLGVALLVLLLTGLCGLLYLNPFHRLHDIAGVILAFSWRLILLGLALSFFFFLRSGLSPKPLPFYEKMLPDILSLVYAPFDHHPQTFPTFMQAQHIPKRIRVADTYGTIRVVAPTCGMELGYLILEHKEHDENGPAFSFQQSLRIQIYPGPDMRLPKEPLILQNRFHRSSLPGLLGTFQVKEGSESFLASVSDSLLALESLLNNITASVHGGDFCPLTLTYFPDRVLVEIGSFPLLSLDGPLEEQQLLQSKEWLEMIFARLPEIVPH